MNDSEIVVLDNIYYIHANSSLADSRKRVLKNEDTFGVFDRYGDIHPIGAGEQGLYHRGTRHLSQMELRVGDGRPLLLNSVVNEENLMIAVDLTNKEIFRDGKLMAPQDSIHIFRAIMLWRGRCYQRLRFTNFSRQRVEFGCVFRFRADYADLFEVRGIMREARGRELANVMRPEGLTLTYEGLDGVVRRTAITTDPKPDWLLQDQLGHTISLEPRESRSVVIRVDCLTEDHPEDAPEDYDEARDQASLSFAAFRSRLCSIHTTSPGFNDWLTRSFADLNMMTTQTPHGPYPYAGVPWFSCPFGRDGSITALETLAFMPEIAAGVLRFQAAHQARDLDRYKDAEPGKIMHEMREGEMARLGEVPFGLYYGSVDSTPLFIMLAAEYFKRTADWKFIEFLWPHIERAIAWIHRYGDADGDGFVEYQRKTEEGLVQQGWKDSNDSVFHADGTLADPPIALCEVQGYVYAALRGAAFIAGKLGRRAKAQEYEIEADRLREKFEEKFWMEDLGCYALALDGRKRQCRVRSSNAGQVLMTGIADAARARITAATLLGEGMFSGWGVRTIHKDEKRYNPMSYHNGSIWPHDNALIAWGFARCGLRDEAERILGAMLDASQAMELNRLPELFCGFPRRRGAGPTLYPVACSPQSWATATVFLLLQATLGMKIDAFERRVSFDHPKLPPSLSEVTLNNLRVGDASLDLKLYRYEQDIGINVTRKEGAVQVVAYK